MQKELWVVEFESANYCGAGECCLVWATSEATAREATCAYTEEVYYEQDSDQFLEDNDNDDEDVCYANITEVYPLASDEAEDIRRYLLDETQKQFYPIVN